MKVNIRKAASILLACICLVGTSRSGLAESNSAPGSAIGFKDPSCLVPEIAPLKLQASGVPQGAEDSIWWYVVLNFNSVTQQGQSQIIKSCVRVGNAAGKKIASAAMCKTMGDVHIRRGVAHFNGGYIICDAINIGAVGEAIGIKPLGDTKLAETFWIAVKGNLSSMVTGTVPLLRYEPVVVNAQLPGTIGIHLMQVSDAQPQGFASTSPDENLQGPGLTIAVKPASSFTGLFEALPESPGGTNLVYRWRLGTKTIAERPVLSLFTPVGIAASTVYIGGLTTGERFIGSLDYIVFDPKGGGRTS